MPTYPIQLKRNGTAAATPSSLLHGEVALNYADGKLFWKDASNVIQSFTFQAYALSSHTHAASDITSGTLDAARIANDSITYAKIQNVSATDRLLGRSSAGSGDVEEITCTAFGRSLIDDADAAAARTTLSVQPTASPAFTGRVGIGAAANAIAYVHIDQTAPSSGGVTQVIRNTVTIPSTTTDYWTFLSAPTTQAASFTLSGMRHFVVDPQGFGAGSTVTNQFGYIVESSMTGATNNYGFYSNIASGTGRWNFYANGTAASFFGGQVQISAGSASACGVAFSGDPDTGIAQLSAAGANTLSICTNSAERVRVDASGNVGIGSGGEASNKITVAGTYPTSGTVTRAMLCSGQVPSGSTVFGDGFVSLIGTVAASFTCANLRHYVAGQGSFGASSAVTNQFGFVAESSLTGATNNYGFYSDIASASNRWNFYAAGSAKNYFNGETLIGTTTDNGAYLLQVNSQIYATNATIATSDARFKTNVESLTDATAVIAALRPVAFDFIPHAERNFATERQVGLIAQEAQAALAGCDYADSVVAQCGDHLGLAYEKLVPVLIRALQESNARIAALEERLNHA